MVRMDITPYVERLRGDLVQTAATGSTEIQDAAERIGRALEPSLRLSLMEVLSEAAAEITSSMRAGGVETRLHGRDVEFVVSAPQPTAPAAEPEPGEDDEDEGTVARITLRIPESIKARAEELAARGGHSLNAWIVNTLRTATRENAVNIDIDLSSIPFLEGDFGPGRKGNRRMTGWI